jgi:preprotein translocase subunit YajC
MPKMHSMTAISAILAQATPATPGGGASAIVSLMPVILIALAMYFLMIAPQRKKQKAQEKMLAELKSGDEVLTTGGIFGTITNVKDTRFVVRIAENVKVEIPKSFVHSVVAKSDGEEKK